MGRIKAMLLSLLGMMVVCMAVVVFCSHVVWHRSVQASLLELRMQIKGMNRIFANERLSAIYIRHRGRVEDVWYQLPTQMDFDSNIIMFHYDDIQLIAFLPEEECQNTIIYLHGGAYINQISNYRLNFCDALAQETDAAVVVPLYQLAPNHTFQTTLDMLTKLYQDTTQWNDNTVTIMGDSAGGGLAASFCEYMSKLGIQQPDHLILISPWLDATMSNEEISNYASVDPMLAPVGLICMGKAWAGAFTNPSNYRISPIFGDVSCLQHVTMFVGTREIFYPDVMKFYYMLDEAGVDVQLYIGEGMNHVYPMWQIPEAETAMQQICTAIQ